MDYQAQEYSEALLPKNKLTNKFLALSEGDKLKTIELGMSMLDNGEKKLNSFNDRDWGEKLERAEKIAIETIEKLREEKELLNKNTEELRYKHKKDMVHLREKIKDETVAIFTTELERLRTQREDLTETLRKYNNKLLEQEKENQKNLHNRLHEIREFYEKKEKQIRIDFQNTIEKQAQLVTTLQDNSYKKEQNSTIKGQTGEEWVYTELLRQLKTVEIESTHHQAEKGDFVLF